MTIMKGYPLLEPFTLRGVTLKNRIMVSPMSMYSAVDGMPDDFHLVHLGRFALGGAGLVMMEATAVEKCGRGTAGCTGIWSDDHIPPLERIASFLSHNGSVPGIQLGHSGPKAATQRPWHGGAPLGPDDAHARGEIAWPPVSSCAVPFSDGWKIPAPLDGESMDRIIGSYVAATCRADDAGFEVIELHCAHGYLLHSFLSPLMNKRDDEFGGSLENRMRFPLRVAEAVRNVWPERKPMFVRVSSIDGVDVGWSIGDTVQFAHKLKDIGIDAIACSSGGPSLQRGQSLAARSAGFQVPFAAQVRAEAGLPTIAFGLIQTAEHANNILLEARADIVALGRELLMNPNWPLETALQLEGTQAWKRWPDQYGWWLERRERSLRPRETA
jgi:2,4-dienoyl-CoA reductase-like NADH-dependent reductase (Old Yellow Enzyme family)